MNFEHSPSHSSNADETSLKTDTRRIARVGPQMESSQPTCINLEWLDSCCLGHACDLKDTEKKTEGDLDAVVKSKCLWAADIDHRWIAVQLMPTDNL